MKCITESSPVGFVSPSKLHEINDGRTLAAGRISENLIDCRIYFGSQADDDCLL